MKWDKKYNGWWVGVNKKKYIFLLLSLFYQKMFSLSTTLNLKQWHTRHNGRTVCGGNAQNIKTQMKKKQEIFLMMCNNQKGISSSSSFHFFFFSLIWVYMPKNSFLPFHKYSKKTLKLIKTYMNEWLAKTFNKNV